MASRAARNASRRCSVCSGTLGVRMITRVEVMWIAFGVLVTVAGAACLCLLLSVMK
jgi:hypothetical protein